jgi:hypothetical protein
MMKTTTVKWVAAAAAVVVSSTAAAQQQPPDFSKIIPGHGPITDRPGLIATRDLILAVRDKIAVLVAQRKTLEEVIAAKPTADFDAQVPQRVQSSER